MNLMKIHAQIMFQFLMSLRVFAVKINTFNFDILEEYLQR